MRTPVRRGAKPFPTAPAAFVGQNPSRWLPLAGLWLALAIAFATVAPVVERATAQVPVPGLTVGMSGTNLLLVITNGSSSANYEIERTPVLGDEAGFPWAWYTNGALGQTSFVAYFGIETRGYFRAAVGTDFDSDGIPNTVDGQPNNGAVGTLAITIDYPANGANIQ